MKIQRPQVSESTILRASKIIAENLNANAKEIAECYRPHMDGYELAKKLEDTYFWDVDLQVVEELEELQWHVEEMHKAICMKWVVDDNIKPPFEIGTEIKEGFIKGIYEHDAAMYTVRERGCDNPNRHIIIKFENAVAI